MDTVESISHHVSPIAGMFGGVKAFEIMQPPLMTISLAVATINIVLYLLVLRWGLTILNNAKCPCAKSWKLKYILLFPPIAIMTAFMTLTWMSSSSGDTNELFGAGGIMIALAVGWIVMIVTGYRYLNDLSVNQCRCATTDMIGDEALQVYTAVKVAWIVMILILAVSGVYFAKTRMQ